MPEKRICKYEGCPNPSHARGWCGTHYLVAVPTVMCAADGCGSPARSRGWCEMHYQRWRKHGDPLVVKVGRPPRSDRSCEVVGCERPHYGQGLCRPHWKRQWRRTASRSECSVDGCERPHEAMGFCKMHYDRFTTHGDTLARPPGKRGPRPHVTPWNKGHSSPRARSVVRVFNCEWCGTEVRRNTRQRRDIRFCSKTCWGRANSGPNHFAWRGVTPENQRIRKSREYRQWRTTVFRRDNFTCQECGIRGVPLQADHILPFALYPELRLELTNGRTLCKPCHMETPTWGGRTRVVV